MASMADCIDHFLGELNLDESPSPRPHYVVENIMNKSIPEGINRRLIKPLLSGE